MGWEDDLSGEGKMTDDTKQDVLNAEERATVNIYRGRVVAGGLVATIDRLAGRVRDLEEALRECCRMFGWCEVKYGKLARREAPRDE